MIKGRCGMFSSNPLASFQESSCLGPDTTSSTHRHFSVIITELPDMVLVATVKIFLEKKKSPLMLQNLIHVK